jgi:hypothetical protein
MTQPEEYYCTACGSTAVVSQAECKWDNVTQDFTGFYVADEGYDYCTECGHDGAEFRPITDVKTLAQIAIIKSERKAA